MKIKSILYYTLILLSTYNSFAQKDSSKVKFSDNLFISSQYSRGILLAHRESLSSLIKDYTTSVLIEVGKSTYGKKPWQELYRYPSLGIGYFYSTLGNDDVFGKMNALYGFIDAPYFQQGVFNFDFTFGFGLAYLNKKYDLEDNIYNIAIGSHINYFVRFSFDFKANLLDQKLYIKTGLGLNHSSNGKIQTPNLGLNLADWHLSAGYYFGRQNTRIKQAFPKREKHTFMFIAAGGLKEFTEPNHGKYFAGNTTFEYLYSVMKKSSWGAGADYFYDGVVNERLIQSRDSNPFLHAGRLGIHATYSINYGKIGFIVQLGTYIAPYYKDDGYLYHRIGFRAKLTKHLLANVSMKTHWARADIVEFGLGYYFTK